MIEFFKKLFRTPPPVRSGVVDAPLRDTDYVVGASPLPYLERLGTGDWSPYCWSEVVQYCWKNGAYVDNLGCTGNALATSIETQIRFLTGKEVKISRRWMNKMSGCNQGALKGIGNYLIAPVDFVRKNGFVLETSYPTPSVYTNDEYYQDIPEPLYSQLVQEGQESLKKYNISYEYLSISDPNIDKNLKHAPILCTIPGHQTCGIFSPTYYTKYRDSYTPFDKQELYTNFQHCLKVVLTPTSLEAGFVKWNNSPEVWFMAKIDSMQTLEDFKNTFPTNYPKYFIKDGIPTLPAKKPF